MLWFRRVPLVGARERAMPTHFRLVHRTLGDGRFHVYTSPDLKGLHVTGDTRDEARQEAVVVLGLIAARRGWPKPIVSFEGEAALHAAE